MGLPPRGSFRLSLVLPLALCILSVALAPGCGGSAHYAPASDSAREALEAALSAWKGGAKPDSLTGRTPPLHAVDFQWQAGAPLSGYTIVSEAPGDGTQEFKVKLSRPKGEDVEAGYVVVGRDPVWVYRQEDYARLLNMEDNPRGAPAPKAGRPSGRRR